MTRNKYHAVRTCGYGSKIESERAHELALLVRAGTISELHEQPRVFLTAAEISYRPDFCYVENGVIVWEEVKGVEGERWRIVKKLWKYYGPGPLRVMRRARSGRIETAETINPKDDWPLSASTDTTISTIGASADVWRQRVKNDQSDKLKGAQ